MMSKLVPWRKKNEPVSMEQRPAHPFEVLHRQMNDLFEDFFKDFSHPRLPSLWQGGSDWGVVAPRFEVAETEKAVQVTAELPGMDEKDIEVTLDDNVLTVKGEKKQEREEKNKQFFLSERSYGQFQRVLTLPAGIEADKIKAQFKKGVLSLSIPKTAQARTEAKRIEVKSE